MLLLESVAWSIVAITFASLSDRWQNTAIAGGFTVAILGVAIAEHRHAERTRRADRHWRR